MRITRAQYEPLMERMAAGDRTAVFEFYGTCRAPIGWTVADAFRRRGQQPTSAVVDVLVLDFCMLLYPMAGAWSPDGGASPWWWARHRIQNIVNDYVGQMGEEFIDAIADVPEPEPRSFDDPSPLDTLRSLAVHDQRCAEYLERVQRIRSERDRELFLEVLVQRAMGDRGALKTAADSIGISHEAARQQFVRARRRVEAA